MRHAGNGATGPRRISAAPVRFANNLEVPVLRILQLIGQTVVGGAESFAFNLSAELARRGHEVLLLANRSNGPLFSRPIPPGLSVASLDRHTRTDPRILSFLIGSVRSFHPDVIHSHNFEANTWARAMGLLFPRLRVFCHEHSGDKSEQPRHRLLLDRALFPRCSGVFAVSESVRLVLATRHHVPTRKLHLLRNGIDTAAFTPPAGRSRNPLAVVCVANLSEVKNHALLLEAWRAVHAAQPAARLTLIGDGRLRPALEAQVRSTGLGDSVCFEGVRPDVKPYLWESAVFALSSRWEAMPLSLMEAMAAGLACVAPSVGGIPEMLEDGVTGKLYPGGDAQALAAAILDFLADPADARRVGDSASARARQAWGMGPCAAEVERWYREALSGHAAG